MRNGGPAFEWQKGRTMYQKDKNINFAEEDSVCEKRRKNISVK